MRTLYIVTHPEATHHVEGVVGGWHDSQLTPAGVRAAVSIAQALRAQIPDGAVVELFSSDLQRTLRTAEEVAELFGVKPVLDRRLREKSYGEAEGRPQEWLDRRFIPPPAVGERMDHDEGVQGAETKASWAQRIYEAMDEILRKPCEHQIIVTHGGSLTCIVASWIKMPIESAGYASFRAPSGSITTLREGLLPQPPSRQPRRHPPSRPRQNWLTSTWPASTARRANERGAVPCTDVISRALAQLLWWYVAPARTRIGAIPLTCWFPASDAPPLRSAGRHHRS
ncbi:histidine phosphatase family protein [Streptomyces sp. NPDC057748]|uniref:histidine phosphatase family protein n=1 Tax=unclassified Streptomyces TaxID=2593676 RepID=UPI003688CFBD